MITARTTTPKTAMTTATSSRSRRPHLAALIGTALLASACASSTSLPETVSESSVVAEVSGDTEEVEAVSTNDADDESTNGADEDTTAEPDSSAANDTTESEADSSESAFSALCTAEPAFPGSRVDVQASGNRIAPGTLNFADIEEIEVELPDNGVWITADPASTGGWYVVLERGSAVRVSADGTVTTAETPAAVPPELDASGTPTSPFRHHELFSDPIDDGRVVVSESIAAVLSTPTDFYPHDVLGDALEAAAVEWVDTCTGERGRIEIAEPDVIEGVSPLIVDIDSDGQMEILVTLSNSEVGARLAAFELDGTSSGESEPIGRGNRWRNQLAVGAFGPSGEVEVIDVRTPHIGGTVQAFRQIIDEENGPSLVQVAASDPNYTSHVIGARNLSMGIALDLDADTFPDVLVATANRGAIVAMTRTDDLDAALQGWSIIGERELTFGLTSNIATQEPSSGRAAVAVADGTTLRIWN